MLSKAKLDAADHRPTVVQLVVSFNSGLQWGISQEYSVFVSSQ